MSSEIQQQFEAGLAMHRMGRLGLAESHYARVVKLDPTQADAWHLLGVVAFQNGHPAKAIRQYRRALELRSEFAQAWNNLGIALKANGMAGDAAAAFERALGAQPQYAEAAFNLGLLLQEQGELTRAEALYRESLEWRGDSVATLTNLGNLLLRTRRAEEALLLLEKAFAREPTPDNAGNLALALLELRRYEAARELAQRAVDSAPEASAWWGALGTAARLQGDAAGAVPALRRAAELAPRDALLRLELALALAASGDDVAARQALSEARELDPSSLALRWADALSVPAIVADEAEADAALEHFSLGVASLAATLEHDAAHDPDALLDAAASASSYRLHYLPRDATALQCRFGDLIDGACRAARPGLARPVERATRSEGRRIRVGFVSAYFSRHSVSRFFARFVTDIDPGRFERFAWHTGELLDHPARELAARVDHFEQTASPPAELAERIRASELDVLVFPDLGMDPRQQVLASWRLAPRQLALYGHPATSGLPGIDAFLSGQLLEPPGSEAHYRERLVRLPALGAAPQHSGTIPDPGWFASWRDARPTLLCLQHLSKLVPAFDPVLARILARSGARLLFFGRSPGLSRRFRERIDPRLRDAGLDPNDALVIEPARGHAEFLGAIEGAELVLDTPWFSGGVTSLDTLAVGTPILAWELGQARGRQTSAMLRLLELSQLIECGADGYVAAALRLISDPTERAGLRDVIRARNARLFDAHDTLAAFQDVLESEARSAR
jgi:predicted O-linked N-acetylglucosamine transferase (SPINDLY family)